MNGRERDSYQGMKEQSLGISRTASYRSIVYGLFILIACLAVDRSYAVEQKKPTTDYKWLMDKPMNIPHLLNNKSITAGNIPNPHQFSKDSCRACHTKPQNISVIKKSHANKICIACHQALSKHDYIHPSDLKPSSQMKKNMDKTFTPSLNSERGKVTCTVCHDLSIQCLDKREPELGLNPYFLRGGPYTSRSDVCYRCHDKKAYQRLNPHEQIDKNGNIKQDKCALCHKNITKLDRAKSIKDVDFLVNGDLSSMCKGCHKWNPHPGGSFNFSFSGKKKKGPNHLVIPPKRIKDTIDKMSNKTGIRMPLDPKTGQVFCGTCHNPHQKGVIKISEAAHGADERFRLRKQDICEQCHDF